jgi:hypothetical protein
MYVFFIMLQRVGQRIVDIFVILGRQLPVL